MVETKTEPGIRVLQRVPKKVSNKNMSREKNIQTNLHCAYRLMSSSRPRSEVLSARRGLWQLLVTFQKSESTTAPGTTILVSATESMPKEGIR